jgi:UDP-glucuronate 4-epimerase
MARFTSTKAILEGRPIDAYNHGNMRRDFTYIADIAEGIIRVLDRAPFSSTMTVASCSSPSTSA